MQYPDKVVLLVWVEASLSQFSIRFLGLTQTMNWKYQWQKQEQSEVLQILSSKKKQTLRSTRTTCEWVFVTHPIHWDQISFHKIWGSPTKQFVILFQTVLLTNYWPPKTLRWILKVRSGFWHFQLHSLFSILFTAWFGSVWMTSHLGCSQSLIPYWKTHWWCWGYMDPSVAQWPLLVAFPASRTSCLKILSVCY